MRQRTTTPVAALVAALAAVLPVLAGCDAERAEAGPVGTTRTVMTDLFTDGGLDPELEVEGEVTAACERSRLSPDNPRARRCFTTETTLVMDPCFVPEAPAPEARLDRVTTIAACLRDPASDRVTKAYVVDDERPFTGRDAVDQWWFMELADGTRCVKVIGVPEIREDLHLSYRCDDGFLYGIPDEAKQVWTIHHRLSGSETPELAEIRAAWS
ncbi:hypothetical protein [Saccharomonospora saliphila]|uniref:hypothetical protein n=1 Tax=Saccharomonospora saliphila TaxID=369829 RepID=UPI00035EFAAB|nr:hypothetical protein [Saccharomonospora saliphila]